MTAAPAPDLSERPFSVFTETPELWQKLAPHTHSVAFKDGNTVIRHGDPAHALWIVNEGWVKLIRQTPDGKETIIGLCTEGDIFGEAALFPHANYPYYAEALESGAHLTSIPSPILRKMMQEDAELSGRIMSVLNQRVAQTQLKLEHMHTLSASQRLGCFLLRLCHSQQSGNKTLHIPIEKHILAAYLGMKAETFSRSFQQLKSLGVSIDGSAVAIEKVEELRDYVCNSCSQSGMCDVDDSIPQ